MSATNSTVNYHFPIFIGTDIPSWLVDWNNAMTALDDAIAKALLGKKKGSKVTVESPNGEYEIELVEIK